MRKIFINEFGRLRSGWRATIFSFACLAIYFLVVTALRVIHVVLFQLGAAPRFSVVANLIFSLTTLIAALGAGYFCVRLLEGLPWRSLGLTLHQRWLTDLVIGFALGFAALAFAVVIAAAAGGLRFSFGGAGLIGPIARSLAGSAGMLFVAALAEEALFRGYPLHTFSRARLALFGVALTSILFGLAHISNPNAVPLVTLINTTLAGIWLAAAWLRTRSLWFPLGVHFSWNWALGSFFGLPISGLSLVSNPLLRGEDLGPAWLTGGDYGIEGGVACTIALVAFTLIIWRLPWVSATPELKKLTSEENPVVPSPVLSIRPADDAV